MRRSGTSAMNRNNDKKPAWHGESSRVLKEDSENKTGELARTVTAMKEVSDRSPRIEFNSL
jgi:hypothetical protein